MSSSQVSIVPTLVPLLVEVEKHLREAGLQPMSVFTLVNGALAGLQGFAGGALAGLQSYTGTVVTAMLLSILMLYDAVLYAWAWHTGDTAAFHSTSKVFVVTMLDIFKNRDHNSLGIFINPYIKGTSYETFVPVLDSIADAVRKFEGPKQ